MAYREAVKHYMLFNRKMDEDVHASTFHVIGVTEKEYKNAVKRVSREREWSWKLKAAKQGFLFDKSEELQVLPLEKQYITAATDYYLSQKKGLVGKIAALPQTTDPVEMAVNFTTLDWEDWDEFEDQFEVNKT